MENESERVERGTAIADVAQTPVIEKAQTTTPEVVTVSLADYQRLQADVASLKQLNKVAQSDKDKKKAQINKSFARKISSVDEMKDDEGWDDKEVRQRKKAYADAAAIQVLELEGLADEEPTPAPFTQAERPPTIGVATPDEQKQGFASAITRAGKLAGVELTLQDMDLNPFLHRRVSTAAEQKAFDDEFDAALVKAIKTKQGKVAETSQDLLEEADAARVAEDVDKFGGLGGNTNRGAPGDSGHRNSKSLDADIGAAYARKYLKPQPR